MNYIVKRETDTGPQYITPHGVWGSDREKAQRFDLHEARWLAFTESTKRKPARAIQA